MREQIWFGILEADRLGRYYGMVSDKYSRWHLILTCVVVVSASSSAASLLAQFPEIIAAVALLIASAVAYLALSQGLLRKGCRRATVQRTVRSSRHGMASALV